MTLKLLQESFSKKKKRNMQSTLLYNLSSHCLRALLLKNNPALASTLCSHSQSQDLTQDPTLDEVMLYCKSLPYSIGMFSFKDHTCGIACLCLRSSSPYYYEQTFIVFDTCNYYSNDPVSVSRKSKAYILRIIISEYFAMHHQENPLPIEGLQHPQVDLMTRYRIIKQRLQDNDGKHDVAKIAVIKHLQRLYIEYHYSCDTSLIGIIAIHAYLSFQCRALNLYPSPPRRVYYWNQMFGSISEPDREIKENVQSLADIRGDIPILYDAIMKEVAKF